LSNIALIDFSSGIRVNAFDLPYVLPVCGIREKECGPPLIELDHQRGMLFDFEEKSLKRHFKAEAKEVASHLEMLRRRRQYALAENSIQGIFSPTFRFPVVRVSQQSRNRIVAMEALEIIQQRPDVIFEKNLIH